MLDIDISVVVLTILNFCVFALLLNLVLFKPLLKFMHRRDEEIQEGTEKGRQAREAIEAAKAECDAEMKRAGKEAADAKKAVRENARKKAAEFIEAEKADANREYAGKIEALAAERKANEARLEERMSDIAALISDKVTDTYT